MSKKFLFSGIASAFVLALALQAAPAAAGEMHGTTSKDAAVEEHIIDSPMTHLTEPSNIDDSEFEVAGRPLFFYLR